MFNNNNTYNSSIGVCNVQMDDEKKSKANSNEKKNHLIRRVEDNKRAFRKITIFFVFVSWLVGLWCDKFNWFGECFWKCLWMLSNIAIIIDSIKLHSTSNLSPCCKCNHSTPIVVAPDLMNRLLCLKPRVRRSIFFDREIKLTKCLRFGNIIICVFVSIKRK